MLPDDSLVVKLRQSPVYPDSIVSAEEQSALRNWYALQDDAESDALGLTGDDKALVTLQNQIEAALTQLTIVTNTVRIQDSLSRREPRL